MNEIRNDWERQRAVRRAIERLEYRVRQEREFDRLHDTFAMFERVDATRRRVPQSP